MVRIESAVEIEAPIERVWGVVSDIDNEPRYWKGTKSVRNIEKRDDVVVREITIAFRDQKCMQEVTIDGEGREVTALFTKGIIAGTKVVSISRTGDGGRVEMRVVWDIRMTGVMGMFTGMVKKHIRNGTETAMNMIKKDLESQ